MPPTTRTARATSRNPWRRCSPGTCRRRGSASFSGTTPCASTRAVASSKSRRLRDLLARKGRVLSVLHPPTAALARVMEQAGCEAGFVGTSAVVGGYTGLADVGTATMSECVQIGKWIAGAVEFPVILDGDTGHGGTMAVRRLVRECIDAGLAGVRIDDQPIEGKRRTQSAGVQVVPLEQAVARYRAAVDMRNELDPDFVVMAQCYARDAVNGGLDPCLQRLRAYEREAGVDWVQFESPHAVDEIRLARSKVKGVLSFMKGKLPKYLSAQEHLALGVNVAWYPGFTHHVIWAALHEFMRDFDKRGIAAWEDFQKVHQGYPIPDVPAAGEGGEKQVELEKRYFKP